MEGSGILVIDVSAFLALPYKDLLELPYKERQFVTVSPAKATVQALAEAAAQAVTEAVNRSTPIAGKIGQHVAGMLGTGLPLVPFGGLAIDEHQAESLQFPVGHPRRKVLYVGHPFRSKEYIPIANFHKALFEHKVIEALELLAALRATSIQVTNASTRGEAKNIVTELLIPVVLLQIGGDVSQRRAQTGNVVYTAELRPSGAPEIPHDLAWYPHEPFWQSLARLRLERGLREFSLDVRYEEDFGVNNKFAAKVKRTGFNLGGDFTNYVSTLWSMKGSFG